MTNEELDQARVDEAWRLNNEGPCLTSDLCRTAARLAREGWTPPVAVDPDIAEAQQIFSNSSLITPIGMTLRGIKRGRELERAVMGNPIPEQIQEVTPPQPVDPDIHMAHAYTKQLLDVRCPLNEARAYDYFLDAIKKARGLERAEAKAKPKLLWGNHDGTSRCPVDRKAWVIVQYPSQFMIGRAGDRHWRCVSRYAEFDADGAVFEDGE